MFEPKKNSVTKSEKMVECPVIPQTGGWLHNAKEKKTEFGVKRPGFEK